MPRGSSKPIGLAAATAKRDALVAQLAQAEDQVRQAEEAARDAGRPVFIAALGRVKLPLMDKADANAIVAAIADHGAAAVAQHLATIGSGNSG